MLNIYNSITILQYFILVIIGVIFLKKISELLAKRINRITAYVIAVIVTISITAIYYTVVKAYINIPSQSDVIILMLVYIVTMVVLETFLSIRRGCFTAADRMKVFLYIIITIAVYAMLVWLSGYIGQEYKKYLLPADATQEQVLAVIDEVNKDDSIHGVLLFRPLPKHLDQAVIENALAPEKDVDCMTDLSMSGVFTGKKIGFPPCTPQACMEILDHYGIDCTGKKAVVIGRSLVVGKPAAMMLVKKNATVTICHTRTVDMPSVAREADIIIVAAGRAGVVGAEYVKEGQTIIDVGINVNAEGKLCGDVDYAAVEPIVDAITPVPGGVGSVTTSVLVGHVVEAAMRKVNA